MIKIKKRCVDKARASALHSMPTEKPAKKARYPMLDLNETDILTKVAKYNLISSGRMIHIDIHEAVFGKLAGKFVAVPNLINIIAKQEYQGTGDTEKEALEDCLIKIKNVSLEDLFPKKIEDDKKENSP